MSSLVLLTLGTPVLHPYPLHHGQIVAGMCCWHALLLCI